MQTNTHLTNRQVEEFFEIGFLIVPAVFSPEEIDRIRLAFNQLEEMAAELDGAVMHHGANFVVDRTCRSDGSAALRRVSWCGAAVPMLLQFGADPRLLGMAAQLLDSREMQPLTNQAHFKMPNDNVEFPWHQDSTHRGFGTPDWQDLNGRGSFVQIATAVDE